MAQLGGEPPQGRQALELAQRRLEHLARVAGDRAAGRLARVAELGARGHRQQLTIEREDRVGAVAGPGQVLEPRRLQPLEPGVGEEGELVVVAGEDDRVAGEVGGVPVMVEVVEVGEQERRPAGLDRLARSLPGLARVVEGAEGERQPGELEELLLEPADPPVGEPRRRLAVEPQVVEADPGAEPERHLLRDLEPVVGEQVAQRGRAAVVAGPVAVTGDHRRRAHRAARSRR